MVSGHDGLRLRTLFEMKELNQQCIKLLNEEWPRSDGSREHSQAKSCRPEPPMSFLLTESKDNSEKLIGHARVCRLPNRDEACWIESVIVTNDKRGLGIGKILMKMVEEYVKRFNFSKAYLSTEDKQEFYARCGYSVCEPVVHSTAATSVFPILKKMSGGIEDSPKPVPQSTVDAEKSTVASGAPPPPPPPPPFVKSPEKLRSTVTTVDHIYMCKDL